LGIEIEVDIHFRLVNGDVEFSQRALLVVFALSCVESDWTLGLGLGGKDGRKGSLQVCDCSTLATKSLQCSRLRTFNDSEWLKCVPRNRQMMIKEQLIVQAEIKTLEARGPPSRDEQAVSCITSFIKPSFSSKKQRRI